MRQNKNKTWGAKTFVRQKRAILDAQSVPQSVSQPDAQSVAINKLNKTKRNNSINYEVHFIWKHF